MGADVSRWLARFGVFDAEEEEVIDLGPEYRALLLGEQRLNPERRSYRYRALLSEPAHEPASADA